MGKAQLTILIKQKPDLAVTVFEQLLKAPFIKHSIYLTDVLSCLYDGIDQCLSVIELFNGSTFDSCVTDTVIEKETIYKLLYLCDHFEEQTLVGANSEQIQTSQNAEMCISPKIDKLLNRIWHLCERGILNKNLIYYSLLSHRNHWMIQRLLHLEDQAKNRIINQGNTNLSAENFLRLIYNRNGEMNIKELFLHSVINKTHFLEYLIVSTASLKAIHILLTQPFCKLGHHFRFI